ncbi:MAG: hypothetical protein EOP14_05160 [Pseudomonas sp.]|nr:MAG: hypothetical protein EOP14_05160 [Pseudomonas sp.]
MTEKPVGELFSRLYIEQGAPVQDSAPFRNRLDAYLQATHYSEYAAIASYLRREAGLVVGSFYGDRTNTTFYKFTDFFTQSPMPGVLSSLTLIYRYLKDKFPERLSTRNPANPWVHRYPKADAWRQFVARAMREENTAFSVDAECGVHFFVDQEFERNRTSVVAALQAARYNAARTAYEQAHLYLDSQPVDTKAAVRSAFESLEIVARLMVPESRNLNKWMVENKLLPLALANVADSTENAALLKIFESIGAFVDSIHLYRHGQGTEEPNAPSTAFAVYTVSSVATALRLLVGVEAASGSA